MRVVGWLALLSLVVACGTDPAPAPPKLAPYTGNCAANQCPTSMLCYEFQGQGAILGAECTMNCATDSDCLGGGACVSFAAGAKFCLAPCGAGCAAGTYCKTRFDGARDLCFVQ